MSLQIAITTPMDLKRVVTEAKPGSIVRIPGGVYAVNLFIFVMGWVRGGRPPFVEPGAAVDFARFADPLPQALVLTAIVISFATTALLLVVLLAARGLTGTDHVDGQEPGE